MKRWLLVITPAIVILFVGGAFVVINDREPEPLPPLDLASPQAPTSSPAPATGPTGSTEGGAATGPTGPTGAEASSGPTGAEASPPPDSQGGGGGKGGGDEDGASEGGGEGQTVTVELLLAEGAGGPPVAAFAGSGATVVINVTSVDVDGRLEVLGLDHRVEVKAGQTASLKFRANKVGTFEIVLDKPANLVGQLYVLP